MRNTVLYVRVATDAYLDENALDVQVALLRTYAQCHGYAVVHTYLDVGSGLSEERPGLQALMDDAKARHFDAVLIRDPSRLFRDWLLFQEYYWALRQECGTQVVFIEQPGDCEDGDDE